MIARTSPSPISLGRRSDKCDVRRPKVQWITPGSEEDLNCSSFLALTVIVPMLQARAVLWSFSGTF